MTKKQYFNFYTSELGWNLVPIAHNTKRPIGIDWYSYWTTEKVLNYLESNPETNFGLLLGNIVDVEADTEAANNHLDRIIGFYPHPVYTSQKSKHHLFLSPDPTLTRFCFQNIEFRGRKHQSVLPPGIVKGVEYKWIYLPTRSIPTMPTGLRRFYMKNKYQQKHKSWEDMIPSTAKKLIK